jgi:hypothetical protein
VSTALDPEEFAQAATAWDRLRIESEAERELQALARVVAEADGRGGAGPRGLRPYANFLNRVVEWLRTGVAPQYARRGTREPMLMIAEALVRRGQLEASVLPRLRGKPRYRTRRGACGSDGMPHRE